MNYYQVIAINRTGDQAQAVSTYGRRYGRLATRIQGGYGNRCTLNICVMGSLQVIVVIIEIADDSQTVITFGIPEYNLGSPLRPPEFEHNQHNWSKELWDQ